MFAPRLVRRTTPLLRALPRQSPLRAPYPALRRTFATPIHPPRPPRTHIPLPTVADKRAEAASLKRRQIVLAIGCILSMATLWLATQTIKIEAEPDPSTPSIKPGTPIILSTAAEKEAGVELVPSGTTSVPAFPKTLSLSLAGDDDDGGDGAPVEYALIGLGIRTVSFLSIEVYVVGLYVAADDLAVVQEALIRVVHPTATAATQAERDELRRVLADPLEGERFFGGLLREKGVRSVLRIVPTRNTDYQHLRDGWVRGIQARSSKSPLYDDDAFSTSLAQFKAAFGQKKSVPKQKTLLLARDAYGRLRCFYDSSGRNDGKLGGEGDKQQVQELGRVEDKRLSSVLWLCYLAGSKVASEPARKSVIEGLMELVERPIGTVGSAMA